MLKFKPGTKHYKPKIPMHEFLIKVGIAKRKKRKGGEVVV